MNRPLSFRPRQPLASSRVLPCRADLLRRPPAGLVSASLLVALAAPSLWALQPAVVQGDNVNVRGRANLAGEVLIQLSKGDVIQMVDQIVAAGARNGEPSRWAQIQLPASVPVYVHASFLEGDTVTASKLNIRGGPGENYSILGRLQKGDKIRSLGKHGDWVQISPTPETYAFVAADYVAEPVAPPPAASPAAAAMSSPASAPAPAVAVPPAPAEPAAAVTPPVPPTVPTSVESVAIAVPPPLATTAPIVVAKIEPAPPLPVPPAVPSTPPNTAAPPSSPAATGATAVVSAPALIALAKAQPQKTSPEKKAAKPAPPPVVSAPSKDLSGQMRPNRDEHPRNRFSLGYRFGMNVSAEFKGFGGSPAVPSGFYDDGYVLPSSRQTGGPNPAPDGRTWNWGYNSPAQVQAGSLLMTRSTSPLSSTTHTLDDNSAAALGFELSYARELWSGGASNDWRFGVEAALNYSTFDFKSTWQQSMSVIRTVETYALGGVVPPYDPATGQTHQGTYDGPGPTIPVNPTAPPQTTTIPNGATMTAQRELEANIYGLRLGPYFEGPIYKRLWGTIGAGVALGLVDGEFHYRDSYTAGVPASNRSGSVSDCSVLIGWYVGAGVSYKFNHSWSVFYNIQYQSLSDYTLNADGIEARLKLGNGIYQSIGVSYSF